MNREEWGGGLGERESGKTSAPSVPQIHWPDDEYIEPDQHKKKVPLTFYPIKIFNKLFFVFIARQKTFTDETSNRLGLCDMYYTYSTDCSISKTHFRKLVY